MSILHRRNLIQNGSFEVYDPTLLAGTQEWVGLTSISGWQLAGTPKASTNWFELVESGHRGVKSEHGNTWLDLDASKGNIAISQQVADVEAGKVYTLFLTVAASHVGNGLEIVWGGQVITLENIAVGPMTTYSITLIGHADDADNTLTIRGTGTVDGYGVSLDDVSLVENPDPVAQDPNVPFIVDKIHENVDAVAEKADFGVDSGRQFFVNFDMTQDRIHIAPELARSFTELLQNATIYQSEGSVVVEFHNGSEVIVFTHTDLSKFDKSVFLFGDGKPSEVRLTGPNLIKNGSFELFDANVASKNGWGFGLLALEGWELGGTAKSKTNWFELHTDGQRKVTASDGKYWLDLDASNGNIIVSQKVQGVEADRDYTLTFDLASSNYGNGVDVYWNGKLIKSVVTNVGANSEFSFVVTGSDDDNVLEFRGTGRADGYGTSLDNVRLVAHEVEPLQGKVYEVALGSGRQYVHDFTVGLDTIVIAANLFQSIADLRAHSAIYQDGAATIISLGNEHDTLVLTGFRVEDLTDAAFVFDTSTEIAATRVSGTDGDDELVQGAGDHMIDAGAGFDVITGGAGADSFVYRVGNGREFVTDFTIGEDRVAVDLSIATTFDELLSVAAIYQDGRSTQIEFADGGIVTLFGINADQANAGWFSFI
jgi:Protein of unknown function (DUF642)